MDYTRTHNPVSLFKAAAVSPFPEWADMAPVPHIDGLSGLSDAAFAGREKRELPIHTKEASFFSMIDFLDNPEYFGLQVGERVKAACESFGIMGDMLPYLKEAELSFEKQASAGEFAIDTVIGETPVKLFPVNNAEDVREAVTGLTKMAQEKRIDYTLMREASMKVLEKAAAFGESAGTLVSSYAVTRFTDPEKSASLIASRGKDAAEQGAYNTIVDELAKGLDPEEAVLKIAAADMAFGYGNRLFQSTRLRPHEIVYCGEDISTLTKAASSVVEIMDVLVPVSALAAIDKHDIEFGLSKSAAATFDPDAPADQLSAAIDSWSDADKKTLLYLAVNA